jgi:hypothetical protein
MAVIGETDAPNGSAAVTERKTIGGFVLDGRELTPYEREILTILAEECNETAKEIMKLLRFGTDQTNPETGKLNNHELCVEVGQLYYMFIEMAKLPVYHDLSFLEGRRGKREKLAKFMMTSPP